MLFGDAVYVGIDPTAGKRPMQFAALDSELRLVALDSGDLEDVLAFVGGLDTAVVSVDAPQSPNLGLLLKADVRRGYNLRPGARTWGDWRICEYELRRRNIRLYNTPAAYIDTPNWMRTGFAIFARLERLGYKPYQAERGVEQRSMLEVHPHACFATLLERRPFLKQTIEGRLQRQLVLYLEGLAIPNPMHALEEITQHHLLTSHLPLEDLYGHDQLDALAGAYTAYLAATKPERITQVGNWEEGVITLPTGEFKEFYS